MISSHLPNPADLLPNFLEQAKQKEPRKITEPESSSAPQEHRYEDANFDVADDKTIFPRERFGRKAYGHGHELILNKDESEKVLKHGTYVILSAEDNPESKAWLLDAECFFKEEYCDEPEKFQAYLATTEEEKRLAWNAINTAKLERLLQLFGFVYLKVDGNYGKDEKSFLVFTPLEGSQQIGQMALTDVIQLMQAIGIFFKQDSVLFSRFLSNIYLYTFGPDFKKMAYGIGFNYVEPNSAYSSTIKVENEKGVKIKLGYSLILDWMNKKMLPDFIRECESTRDDRYKKFSLVYEEEKIAEKYQPDLLALAELRLEMLTSFVKDTNSALDKKRREEKKPPTDLTNIHIDLETLTAPQKLQQQIYSKLLDFFLRIQSQLKEEKRKTLLAQLNKLNDPNNDQTYHGMLNLINELVETIHFHLQAPNLILEDKASVRAPNSLPPSEKLFIMTRGTTNYNELGEDLYDYYTSRGYKVAMISSDAHINRIGEEYPWYAFENDIVPRMLARNKIAHKHYLDDKNDSVDVYIYCDMNTKLSYMKKRAQLAIEKGFKPVVMQSSYEIDKHLYYLENHLQDSEMKEADYLPLGDGITIPQLKFDCNAKQLVSMAVRSSDAKAVANSLGVFATDSKGNSTISSHILSPSPSSAPQ